MSYVGKITAGGSTHLVGSTLYGTCSTAIGTTAKVGTLANFDKLETGVTVHIKFTNGNSATAPTLNVNSTGAKKLLHGNTGTSSYEYVGSFSPGAVVAATYDGANWVVNGIMYDTKNTAGASNSTSTKLYLVGSPTQSAFETTATTSGNYIGTDGHIYSNSKQVVNLSDTQALTNKTYNGYTLAGACAKSVDTSISTGSSSANLPTTAAVASFVASQVTGAAAFQGSIGSSTSTADYTQATLEASSYVKGWYWVVNAAGTYVGKACGVGDMLYATKDKGSAYSASDFTVVQNEMDSITNAEIDTIVAS